jgi:hypothetical protein
MIQRGNFGRSLTGREAAESVHIYISAKRVARAGHYEPHYSSLSRAISAKA